MVIQVLTITQRFRHRDTGYFHIPDGCYFNYTELLDFVLWIYMFFSSSVDAMRDSQEGYSVVLNLLFIECLAKHGVAWETLFNYIVYEISL